jgi:hypothetical protein
MPDGNHGDAKFGVRSRVAAFDTVDRIGRCERSEDAVGVVEGVLEIFDTTRLLISPDRGLPFRSLQAVSCLQIR